VNDIKGKETVEIILLHVGNLWHAGTLNRVKNDSVPLLYVTVALPQLQLCGMLLDTLIDVTNAR